LTARLAGGLCAIALGACVSEGTVLGEHGLPDVDELADAILRPPGGETSFPPDRVELAGDLDGDGTGDLIAYAEVAGRALYLRYGGSDWSGEQPIDRCAMNFSAPINVSTPGDLDGDSLADLLVSTVHTCRHYVVYGSRERLCGAAPADHVLTSCGPVTAKGVGDVDGDGLADFVIAPLPEGAALFHGRSARIEGTLLEEEADARLLAGDDEYFGVHAAPAGDTDGDGLSDFVLSEGAASFLYRGAAERLTGQIAPERAAARLVDESIGLHEPVGVGDLDRDGRDDIAVNGFRSLFSIYYGGGDVFDAADAALIGTSTGAWGARIKSGDIDDDGALDLLISDPELDVGDEYLSGGVHILFGTGERLPDTVPLIETSQTLVSRNSQNGGQMATSIAVGDLDGDQVVDLAVASPGKHAVYVVLGPLARGQ
jgi:FG-GAP-like repeat/FG-GAP repeat